MKIIYFDLMITRGIIKFLLYIKKSWSFSQEPNLYAKFKAVTASHSFKLSWTAKLDKEQLRNVYI